jgi:hypothetical protein
MEQTKKEPVVAPPTKRQVRRTLNNRRNRNSRNNKENPDVTRMDVMQEINNSNPSMSESEFIKWKRFVEQLSANGPDLRNSEDARSINSAYAGNVNCVAKVSVDCDSESIVGISCGIMSHAMQQGWRQKLSREGHLFYIYHGFVFIYQTIVQVMEGNQDQVPKVMMPDFFLEILAAVQPKNGVQCGTGILGYSWVVNNSSNVPPREFFFPAYNIQYGRYVLGVAQNAFLLGYNEVNVTGAIYDPAIGKLAFQDMVNFVNSRLVIDRDHYHPYQLRMYDLAGTELEWSVSAFASSNKVVGGGVMGGFAYGLGALETTIKHPKFVVFADPDQKLRRGFSQYKAIGGDSTWLVASLLSQVYKSEVRNPNYTCFKPVDFFEICHRVAKSIALMMQYYIRDDGFTDQFTDLGITGDDFLILMRRICLMSFPLQYGTQSLRFYNDADEFVPLLTSSNTTNSDQVSSILFPLYFVENLNALTPRRMLVNVNPATGKVVKRNPRNYVPVLGRYTLAAFNIDDYTVDTGESTNSIFIGGQPVVNIVDGSINQGNGLKYIDLDTSDKINQVATILSGRLDRLKAYMQAPTYLGGDGGINVLTVVGDTFMIKGSQVSLSKDKIKSKKGKGIDPVLLGQKKLINIMSQQRPFRDILRIKKGFVTPEYRYFESQDGVGSVSSETMRILNRELWLEEDTQFFAGSETNGTLQGFDALREQFVSLCVKQRTADNDTVITQMEKLAAAGAAGILGSLVGVYGGEMAKTAVTALSTLIPL